MRNLVRILVCVLFVSLLQTSFATVNESRIEDRMERLICNRRVLLVTHRLQVSGHDVSATDLIRLLDNSGSLMKSLEREIQYVKTNEDIKKVEAIIAKYYTPRKVEIIKDEKGRVVKIGGMVIDRVKPADDLVSKLVFRLLRLDKKNNPTQEELDFIVLQEKHIGLYYAEQLEKFLNQRVRYLKLHQAR